jgi:hypothetical protein
VDELRHLLIHLSENWPRNTNFFHDGAFPGPIISQNKPLVVSKCEPELFELTKDLPACTMASWFLLIAFHDPQIYQGRYALIFLNSLFCIQLLGQKPGPIIPCIIVKKIYNQISVVGKGND